MNISINQLFLMTTLSFFYTPAMLPTKSRDHRHAKQKRILAIRGVKKQTTNHMPISSGIGNKYYNASYVSWDYTSTPALYDIKNAVDLSGDKATR